MTNVQMTKTDNASIASMVRTAWAEGTWVREAWEGAHAERLKTALPQS